MNTVARGAVWTFGGSVAGIAFNFAIRAILARHLGEAQYGQVVLGLAVMTLAGGIAVLGLDIGVARFIPHYQAGRLLSEIKGSISSAIRMVVPASLIIAIILFFLAPHIAARFFHEPPMTNILRIFVIALPAFAMSQLLVGALRGFKRMDYHTYSRHLFRDGSQLIVALLAVSIGFGAFGVSVGYAAAFFAVTAISFLMLLRASRAIGITSDVKGKNLSRELLGFSWPLVISQQVLQARRYGDSIILGFFTSVSLVGIYNVATPVARLLQLGLTSVNSVFMPSAAELYSRGEIESLREAYSTVARWTFFITLPLFLIIIVYAGTILDILFGSQYAEARVPLIILSVGFFINAVSGSFGEMLIAIGKPAVNTVSSILALIASIILNVSLIPLMGLAGAAIAGSVSLVLAVLVGGGYLYYHLGLQPYGWIHVRAILAIGLPLAFLALGFSQVPETWQPWALPILVAALYVLSFAGLVLLRCMDKRELEFIRTSILRPISGRILLRR